MLFATKFGGRHSLRVQKTNQQLVLKGLPLSLLCKVSYPVHLTNVSKPITQTQLLPSQTCETSRSPHLLAHPSEMPQQPGLESSLAGSYVYMGPVELRTKVLDSIRRSGNQTKVPCFLHVKT